ncbi:MAG: ComF family protein [Alphaproteobacteria bacterium]|nr:ComF family protein [Alphaproteobacteria bacterium]
MSILSHIVEFLFPPACPICGTPVETHGELCGDCWGCFDWIDGAHCAVCGYPFPDGYEPDSLAMCPVCAAGKNDLDIVRAACVYDDMSRLVMLPFKHGGKIKFARFMSRAMIWALRDVGIKPDMIMPVPLAARRLFHRGYNQATLLAREISHAYGVPIDFDSVHRKYRPNMGHKTHAQRATHIRGVFNVVHRERIRGKKILLVDDVMTSGATFAELARVLRRAGATEIYGVVFCRVVRAE